MVSFQRVKINASSLSKKLTCGRVIIVDATETNSYIQFYYKEKITLQELATAGSVCKTGCNKIFKTFTGRTPIEYITDHRLRKAIEMIENRDMSLTEICYECGFAGASYFSETFKKVFGISPGKFKRTSNYDREFFKAYRR